MSQKPKTMGINWPDIKFGPVNLHNAPKLWRNTKMKCFNPGCPHIVGENDTYCITCLAAYKQQLESETKLANARAEATQRQSPVVQPGVAYDRRKSAENRRVVSEELSGGDVNYYLLEIKNPKRLDPYTAECEDIIAALGMTFFEGCIFKALWRSCNKRTNGIAKQGQDDHGIYDGDKIEHYGKLVAKDRRQKASK